MLVVHLLTLLKINKKTTRCDGPINSISLHFGHTFADSVTLTATCFEHGFGPICRAYYSPKEHNQNSKPSGNLKTILYAYTKML